MVANRVVIIREDDRIGTEKYFQAKIFSLRTARARNGIRGCYLHVLVMHFFIAVLSCWPPLFFFLRRASYARDDAKITIRGVALSENAIARGSVVFLASSSLYTNQVDFIDFTGSTDLSAVQVDDKSTYVAVETAFNGFEGEVGRNHQQRVKNKKMSTRNMGNINSHPCITCKSF